MTSPKDLSIHYFESLASYPYIMPLLYRSVVVEFLFFFLVKVNTLTCKSQERILSREEREICPTRWGNCFKKKIKLGLTAFFPEAPFSASASGMASALLLFRAAIPSLSSSHRREGPWRLCSEIIPIVIRLSSSQLNEQGLDLFEYRFFSLGLILPIFVRSTGREGSNLSSKVGPT